MKRGYLWLVAMVASTACGTTAQPIRGADSSGWLDAATLPADTSATVGDAADPTPPTADLVISELQPAPLLHEDAAGDYIEVVNLSRFAVPLSELALVLPNGKRVVPERPHRPWLAAGEVSVWQAMDAPGGVRVRGMRLPDAAGRLELWWRGRTLDVVHWLRKKPWPKMRAGVAVERVSPRSDGTSPTSWRAAAVGPTAIEAGSPGVVTWPCTDLLETALARPCPPPKAKRLLGCGGGIKGR